MLDNGRFERGLVQETNWLDYYAWDAHYGWFQKRRVEKETLLFAMRIGCKAFLGGRNGLHRGYSENTHSFMR